MYATQWAAVRIDSRTVRSEGDSLLQSTPALFFGRSGGITSGHINTHTGEGEITFDALINLP